MIGKGCFFIRNLYYTINSLKHTIFLKGTWYRDETSYDWSKSFIKYITETKNKDEFLEGFDEKSRKLGKAMLKKIENIMFKNILRTSDVLTKEDNKEQKEFSKKYFTYIKDKAFPSNEVGSFFNLHYVPKLLDIIPGIGEYLKNKDIIDAGAYIGDSSIAFSRTFKNIKNIYAFEPVTDNFDKMNMYIKSNNTENIIPVQKGVGRKNEIVKIQSDGAMSKIGEDGNEQIEIVNIDNFVDETKIIPGLIKWDIEGFEYDSILGTKETIKKFKPILLISIYHNGKDFFEIKNLINSRELGYKFKLTRWNYFHPYADTLLICY